MKRLWSSLFAFALVTATSIAQAQPSLQAPQRADVAGADAGSICTASRSRC